MSAQAHSHAEADAPGPDSGGGTLWVHVTTALNWDRPPVGIVRVEQAYCRWLLTQQPAALGVQVRWCVYDRGVGSFVEVPRAAVHARILPGVADAIEPPAPRPPLTPWKQRIKDAAQRLIPYLPAPWVPQLRRNARTAYHHLLVARARLSATLRRWTTPAGASGPPPAAFGRGDRFISLGLDWEYLDQERLYALKQQHALAVTLICYDVIPLRFPHLVVLEPGGFGAYFVDMAWTADQLLCISEHTRTDCELLLQQLGVPVPPTDVIRLGTELKTGEDEAPPPGPLADAGDDRPFVLYVSTIERRKNHELLYRAWTRLRERGLVPHRLVFVGMPGWGVADLLNDLRLDPRIQDDIVCLHHVSDGQLAWLYRHAAFTVFPSLYEGWGLPVAESLAWGKFCLASNAAALPEAGGHWAEYLDPWDLPAWVERLAQLMADPQEVARRNAQIASSYVAPGWADTAQSIHALALRATPRAAP